MFFIPFLIPLPLPAILQDILILDKEYLLDVGRPIITVPMTTLPARWWTNHHVSSSSTRKLDTGHWPMLAVVWAMSPAPKMKEASAASHDLYSVRCAYQFREIHSHPQDQVTESVHCSPVERRVSIIYSHTVVYSLPRYLAFWFTEIAVAELVVGIMTANYLRFFCWVNSDHHF